MTMDPSFCCYFCTLSVDVTFKRIEATLNFHETAYLCNQVCCDCGLHLHTTSIQLLVKAYTASGQGVRLRTVATIIMIRCMLIGRGLGTR